MTPEKAIEIIKQLCKEITEDFNFKIDDDSVCLLDRETLKALECALSIMENSKSDKWLSKRAVMNAFKTLYNKVYPSYDKPIYLQDLIDFGLMLDAIPEKEKEVTK